MDLGRVKERITKYISSEKNHPIIVDLQNKDDLAELKDYFDVGNNVLLYAHDFCAKDGLFKLEELYDAISKNSGDIFIVGLTAYLKLQGASFLKKVLNEIIQKSIEGHIVVFTYQCKNYMKYSAPRVLESGRIIIADGNPDIMPDIYLINSGLMDSFPGSYEGIQSISKAVETDYRSRVYIATEVGPDVFEES